MSEEQHARDVKAIRNHVESGAPDGSGRFFTFPTIGDANDEELCFFSAVPSQIQRFDYRLRFGQPLADVYPPDAKILLAKEYRGIKLRSHIGNTKGAIAASRDFADAIRGHCEGVAIEYLPFVILDHRRRVLTEEYVFVNPLGTVDCTHAGKSQIAYSDTGKVIGIDRLVLDARKLEKTPALFRVDKRASIYVVNQALADEIRARKLTNVLLEELEVA